jgi:hypothetical protein
LRELSLASEGQVVVSPMAGTQPQSIVFPANEFTCTATLDAVNAWSIDYSP